MTGSPDTTLPGTARPPRTYFDLLLAASAVILVISNIAATKGVAFGPILTDGGFFLYPLAYIVGDIIAEVYGFAKARRVIFASFSAAAFAALTFWITIKLPSADFYENQTALETVLGPVPLIVAGSLLGYLVGQLLNSWVMVALKKRTAGRFLVARLVGSTLVGQLADTLIFCSIAAPILGIETLPQFFNYLLVGYAYKCLVEVVLVPITYPLIQWFKKKETAAYTTY
ncbi:queuosine precursor transporter [Rothia sp. ZJ932]|uniref:queuosine precursor transporter n=1 Tax=Rothia sp. ZJ932 TaxID=2810516 RepID=UPI001968A382|nr:queuosine precursor transporter [Rothia sp. ZJ932]QRZ61383.1 queuosine precursor transporter [Rothia sp. ZJ932]